MTFDLCYFGIVAVLAIVCLIGAKLQDRYWPSAPLRCPVPDVPLEPLPIIDWEREGWA